MDSCAPLTSFACELDCSLSSVFIWSEILGNDLHDEVRPILWYFCCTNDPFSSCWHASSSLAMFKLSFHGFSSAPCGGLVTFFFLHFPIFGLFFSLLQSFRPAYRNCYGCCLVCCAHYPWQLWYLAVSFSACSSSLGVNRVNFSYLRDPNALFDVSVVFFGHFGADLGT